MEIIQGGFEEASQLRCCEKYLEKLPEYLGCNYKGTLIKGGMFMLTLMNRKSRKKVLDGFIKWDSAYEKKHGFNKEKVTAYAAPEYYKKKEIIMMRFFKPINKVAWVLLAKKLKADGRLDARPYSL